MSTGISHAAVIFQRQAEESDLELRQRLLQQCHIYDATLSFITDIAYTFDREGRFLYVNQPLLDLWGLKLEDIVGRNFFDLHYPDELATRLLQQIQHVVDTGRKLADETRYTSPTGVDGYYEYIFNPVIGPDGKVEMVVGSAHNITHRKQAEVAMVKSEKLAAAGRLAGALAHEINNPLQAVTNLVALLKQSPRLNSEDKKYAVMAEDELARLIHLTQQSLGFYREAVFPRLVEVEDVVENTLALYAQRLEAKQIHVKKRFISDRATIHSYPGEIRQVFSTILMNAMEAVPEHGTISICVRKSTHYRDRSLQGVRVGIADNGAGIPKFNRAHIFEPFFTTKGEQGTGLGLWVASGIVNRLGGTIRMRSTVHPANSGTSFSIFLPCSMPEPV